MVAAFFTEHATGRVTANLLAADTKCSQVEAEEDELECVVVLRLDNRVTGNLTKQTAVKDDY